MPMWGRLLSKADFRVFNVARAAHLGKFVTMTASSGGAINEQKLVLRLREVTKKRFTPQLHFLADIKPFLDTKRMCVTSWLQSNRRQNLGHP